MVPVLGKGLQYSLALVACVAVLCDAVPTDNLNILRKGIIYKYNTTYILQYT